MNIIIQGPQGSGKGTQAELLQKKFGMEYFETGKILRAISVSKDPQAEVVRSAMDAGELVPNEYLRQIVWDFIQKHNSTKGLIFDGYPRSLSQYENLKEMLSQVGKKVDALINIEISEAETIKRLSARRVCRKCGEIFNLESRIPKKSGVCDICGGELIHREDDTPEAIKRRLAIYRVQTHPVLDQARVEGIALEFQGEQGIESLHENILQVLKTKGYE